MSYDKKHIKILDPETGYDKIYKEYKKYHSFLDNFDKKLWQRFIPKNLEGKTIIDLGCGDGRISNFFNGKGIKEYIGIDISENMLKNSKISTITKIKADLNNKFPIDDKYGDIIISLFTLLHIDNIKNFFEETYRILKDDGIFILFHHIERKNHIYKTGKETFKISTNKWPYNKIEELLDYNFFKFNIYDIFEDNIVIGKYFICKK